VRGTLVRFRYDQFMRLGWKVLLPAALGWIVVLTAVKAVDTFTTYHFNEWFVPLLSGIVVLFVIMWYWPQEYPAAEPAQAGEFDPLAGGFPVPPLPGQTLPSQVSAAIVLDAVDDGGVSPTEPNVQSPREEGEAP
jgi:NADH-quinone oxidoreductase subunit H